MTPQYLYLTPDDPALPTGGGKVVKHELAALRELGEVLLIRPADGVTDPFRQDLSVREQIEALHLSGGVAGVRLAHCYAGSLGTSCAFLKGMGIPITYTVAAHDVAISKRAHEEQGLPFPYPHLTDPKLWDLYSAGYREYADVVIVPGIAPLETVVRQGVKGKTKLIPHGIERPTRFCTATRREFAVGYLGATGPDKGLLDLVKAFSQADIPRAKLILCGRDVPAWSSSILPHMKGTCKALGWVEDVADFFDQVTVYCQPSRSEGYGISVAESLAHGVPVLCSTGAGVADMVRPDCRFPAGDVDALAQLLRGAYDTFCGRMNIHPRFDPRWFDRAYMGAVAEATYNGHSWSRVAQQYQELWRGVRR